MAIDRFRGLLEQSGPLTMTQYQKLIQDRPPKAEPDSVDYRPAESKETCSKCLHFYTSTAAKRSVCEIMRPRGDRSVLPSWTCSYWTANGRDYPLLNLQPAAIYNDAE